MIYTKNTSVPLSLFDDGLRLDIVKKSNNLFVKWYIEHYPQSKGIVGRQINYLIYNGHSPIGIISGASPPLNYKIFRKYFNIDNDLQFLNNNVYRIVEKTEDKNLGTKILKIFRTQIFKDYYNKYKTNLLGLVTFVEPPRTGAIYKADNWECLGKTQGTSVRRKGNNWYEKQYIKGEKNLYLLINIKKQQKRDIMAEMKEEHFEVVSSNKAREYEKTKKTLNIIRTLLNRYSKRQLIEMIEKESNNG